jgi:hypothetical protein
MDKPVDIQATSSGLPGLGTKNAVVSGDCANLSVTGIESAMKGFPP